MKTYLFQSCGHCWVFQIYWHIECSTFTASSFMIWKSSTGIPSPPLALFIVMLSKAHLTSHSRMYGWWYHLIAEKEEELKSLLMKVKEESKKGGLKLNIQITKVMASCPIVSWQIDGETGETVSDFIFLGSKITADGDCSHEIKRHLLLGRKVMTNLDSIFKSRDITLPQRSV